MIDEKFLIIFGFIFIALIFIIMMMSSKKKKINTANNSIEIINKYKPIIQKIINNNNDVNEARKKYKSSKSTIKIICCIIIILSVVVAIYSKNYHIFIITIVTPLVGLTLTNFRNDTKLIYNNIIPNIVRDYNDNMTYNHYKNINRSEYKKADFEEFDTYHSEDLITGSINNCPYQISEIETQVEETDDEGNKDYTTSFSGTFAKIELNKNFNCTIEIVNEYTNFSTRDNHITMDNEEFEKIYDVFTDDKILAMRLLTPDVTSKMIDLYNETGIYFEIKIVNDIMYIRLHTAESFEFYFSTPEKEAELLAKSIAQLDSIYIIMNSFLNEIERIDI